MLQNDFSISTLLNNGYITIYNKTYDYNTKDAEISEIKNNCVDDSILCVGGGARGDDNMRLVSCGNCLSVLAVTLVNKPNYVGSAYWYYTPTRSFGFSPTNSISQNSCDNSNLADNFRLCWHTNNIDGGYRVGNLYNLNTNSDYSKYVFLKTSKFF